jgi:hypothetical protein
VQWQPLASGLDGTGRALALSPNGEVLVGGDFIHADGIVSPRLARYSVSGAVCAADLDDGTSSGTRDGCVTVEDLIYFLDAFAQGTPRADLDDGSFSATPDGGVSIDDLPFFLARFQLGC